MLKKMKGKMKRRNTEPVMVVNQGGRFAPAEPLTESSQQEDDTFWDNADGRLHRLFVFVSRNRFFCFYSKREKRHINRKTAVVRQDEKK